MAAPHIVPASTLRRIHAAARGRSHPVIAIDGPSGAGKSTLADAVARDWRRQIDVVRLDDVYPGWGGLDAGAAAVSVELVRPRARGTVGRVGGWNWETGRPSAGYRVRPGAALVVEGCGAFEATRGQADVRVRVAAPDALRRRLALARDAGAFDPHWAFWDAQWRRYVDRTGFHGIPALDVRVVRETGRR